MRTINLVTSPWMTIKIVNLRYLPIFLQIYIVRIINTGILARLTSAIYQATLHTVKTRAGELTIIKTKFIFGICLGKVSKKKEKKLLENSLREGNQKNYLIKQKKR